MLNLYGVVEYAKLSAGALLEAAVALNSCLADFFHSFATKLPSAHCTRKGLIAGPTSHQAAVVKSAINTKWSVDSAF